METLPRYLKVSDVQEHLRISKKSIYKLIALKGFPTIKIGRQYLIPEDQYLKWLNKHMNDEVLI